MYDGMFMPDGSVPPGIMQNGKRSRNKENFQLNQASYRSYMGRLMELVMRVFEWSGLPDGVDVRMLEYWLMRDGFVAFFHDPDLATGRDSDDAPE